MAADTTTKKSHHHFILLALVLMIVWVVLRVALAVTGVALHLLWIGAIICAVVWIMRQVGGRGSA
jgi:hypothetical protein